jgi:hypothetical protein
MFQRSVARKRQGQALIVIAGAMVALMALVALAVDGGNAFAQRRIVQNAADGAAMAGLTKFNEAFLNNRGLGCTMPCVSNMTPDQNRNVWNNVVAALRANGADTVRTTQGGTVEAWYLDMAGQKYGTNQVGVGSQSIPFAGSQGPGSNGAAGIWVGSTAQAATYFARVIGVNQVKADAHATAQMGGTQGIRAVQTGPTGPVLWPLTIFSDSISYDPQRLTTLYDFSDNYVPGNWGLLCFQHPCGQDRVNTWLRNGFDPSTGTDLITEASNGSQGSDERLNYYPVGWDGANPSSRGVWQPVKTGNGISSACDIIKDAATVRRHVFIPISDRDNNSQGDGELFHVVNVAEFEIQQANCTGSHNGVQGKFLGFNWTPSSGVWKTDVWTAVVNGQTLLRLGQ